MADLSLADGCSLLDLRTRRLRVLLHVALGLIVIDLILIVIELAGLFSIDTTENGSLIIAYAVFGLATLIVSIAAIVYFAMWIYRAAANVQKAEVAGFEYTPGWAVGWYFIPIANLFKPYAAMRQIWNASHNASGYYLDDNNGILIIWWATWLSSNIATNTALRLQLSATTVEEMSRGLVLGAVGDVICFLLYPVAVRMITEINNAQQRHFHAGEVFA